MTVLLYFGTMFTHRGDDYDSVSGDGWWWCFVFLPNSTRKRMSVIMRIPSGKIRLYCKGAVSIS